MITLIIFIVLYLLSVWYNFVSIRKVFYHPEGCFYGQTPDKFVKVAPMLPFFSFITSIVVFFAGWRHNKYNNEKNMYYTKKYDHLKE